MGPIIIPRIVRCTMYCFPHFSIYSKWVTLMSDTEEKEVPERIVGGYQHGLGPAATPADCRGYRGPVPVRGRAQHPNGHLHRLPATRDTPGEASSPATMPMQWALLNRPPPLPLPQFGYRGNTRGYFFFSSLGRNGRESGRWGLWAVNLGTGLLCELGAHHKDSNNFTTFFWELAVGFGRKRLRSRKSRLLKHKHQKPTLHTLLALRHHHTIANYSSNGMSWRQARFNFVSVAYEIEDCRWLKIVSWSFCFSGWWNPRLSLP